MYCASRRIRNAFPAIEAGRAAMIAQTETAAAYSFSSDQAMRAAGIKYKQWFHSPVPPVPRPAQNRIDRLSVPLVDQ